MPLSFLNSSPASSLPASAIAAIGRAVDLPFSLASLFFGTFLRLSHAVESAAEFVRLLLDRLAAVWILIWARSLLPS